MCEDLDIFYDCVSTEDVLSLNNTVNKTFRDQLLISDGCPLKRCSASTDIHRTAQSNGILHPCCPALHSACEKWKSEGSSKKSGKHREKQRKSKKTKDYSHRSRGEAACDLFPLHFTVPISIVLGSSHMTPMPNNKNIATGCEAPSYEFGCAEDARQANAQEREVSVTNMNMQLSTCAAVSTNECPQYCPRCLKLRSESTRQHQEHSKACDLQRVQDCRRVQNGPCIQKCGREYETVPSFRDQQTQTPLTYTCESQQEVFVAATKYSNFIQSCTAVSTKPCPKCCRESCSTQQESMRMKPLEKSKCLSRKQKTHQLECLPKTECPPIAKKAHQPESPEITVPSCHQFPMKNYCQPPQSASRCLEKVSKISALAPQFTASESQQQPSCSQTHDLQSKSNKSKQTIQIVPVCCRCCAQQNCQVPVPEQHSSHEGSVGFSEICLFCYKHRSKCNCQERKERDLDSNISIFLDPISDSDNQSAEIKAPELKKTVTYNEIRAPVAKKAVTYEESPDSTDTSQNLPIRELSKDPSTAILQEPSTATLQQQSMAALKEAEVVSANVDETTIKQEPEEPQEEKPDVAEKVIDSQKPGASHHKYRLGLPQHEDLNLCVRCRCRPSPLVDSKGNVFCPMNCGCCMCAWKSTRDVSGLPADDIVHCTQCKYRGADFLAPDVSRTKCTALNWDTCPCRDQAAKRFLEMYGVEMFSASGHLLNIFKGREATLSEVVCLSSSSSDLN